MARAGAWFWLETRSPSGIGRIQRGESDAVPLDVFVAGVDSSLVGWGGAEWGRIEEAMAGLQHSELGVC